MFIYLYFTNDLACPRHEIEKALEEAFEGSGEICGAGTGADGCNVDLEVFDDNEESKALAIIGRVLGELGVPESITRIQVAHHDFEE
ncbi:MAG: hypothetical protein ABFD69_15215 [Candidatus Sumerlaeia bacterium]